MISISNPRVSPNGGVTWPIVSSLLSSELATPASSLDSARCGHTSSYLWFNCTTLPQPLHNICTTFSCTTINSKVKSGLGDWTCDDCTDIMTRVAAFMVKPETIEQGLAVLNVSKQFCLL